MKKQILLLAGSPRKNGNSDTLCNSFKKGCEEQGHQVQKIYLQDQHIQGCTACYACKKLGHCILKDDAAEVQRAMIQADVIVLASPVYFYSISGQLKTLIDRCLSCAAKLSGKDFYFLLTAADSKEEMKRAADALTGFTDCISGSRVKGIVYGDGAWQLGDIQGHPALEEAYQLGKQIQ